MIWKAFYIFYPIYWILLGLGYIVLGLWNFFYKVGYAVCHPWETLKDFLLPEVSYYSYVDQNGQHHSREYYPKQEWQLKKDTKTQCIAQEYYEILKEKIKTSYEIDELNKYGDKIDKVITRRYFPLEYYQELIDLYYRKLEQLESLAKMEADTRKRERVSSEQT